MERPPEQSPLVTNAAEAKRIAGRLERFRDSHGFEPDLVAPLRFSEKLLVRILFDFDPYYLSYACKLFAPDFFNRYEIKGVRIPVRYGVAQHLTPAVLDALPEQFVLKSAFGSGLNQIVERKSTMDVADVCKRFGERLHVIKNAQDVRYRYNCVIIEEYLGDDAGGLPDDCKIHCFRQPNGDVEVLIQIDSDRFGSHRQTIVDEHYRPLELVFGGRVPHHELPPRPVRLDDAVGAARMVAADFDYIRVDFLFVGTELYFGELTPFHNGGGSALSPEHWDVRLGQMWHQTRPSYSQIR
jgi:hypothetical protein